MFGRRGQMRERLGVLARQSGALSVQPVLELRRVVHVEALEQRTAIRSHRVGVPAAAQRQRERVHIGVDGGRV